MKTSKTSIVALWATLSICGLSACAVEPEPSAEASSQEVSATATATGDRWISITEWCVDYFNRSCTGSFPSPQCAPTVTEGAACTGPSECYRTISSTRFKVFNCI